MTTPHHSAHTTANIPIPSWDNFKPGVQFRDILPAFADPTWREVIITDLTTWCTSHTPDVIVGIDARGFLLGPLIADRLGSHFVPIRKAGKTPGPVITTDIVGEYAQDTLEIRPDLMPAGARAIIVDDLVATGGSMLGAIHLTRDAGADVVGCAAFVDLPALGGSARLAPTPFHATRTF